MFRNFQPSSVIIYSYSGFVADRGIFRASEIWLREITEARSDGRVQRMRCRVNVNMAEDISEDMCSL